MANNLGRLARDSLSPCRSDSDESDEVAERQSNESDEVTKRQSNEIAEFVERLMEERVRGREERARLHVADLQESLHAANKQVTDLKESLHAANKQVTDLKESLQVSQHRVAEVEARVAEVEASAAQAKIDADRRIAGLTTKLKAGFRLLTELVKAFEETGNDTASTDAPADNESSGSATVVNSSVSTGQQSNQPEQQLSPSSSDASASANARIKREESPLFIVDQPSDENNLSCKSEDGEWEQLGEWTARVRDFPRTYQRSGLMVDEVDMIQSYRIPSVHLSRHGGESNQRIRESKEEDEAIRQGGAKRLRTE